MSLSRLFERVRREAVKSYLADTILIPRLYCLGGDRVRVTYPLLFNNDEEKEQAHARILQYAKPPKD